MMYEKIGICVSTHLKNFHALHYDIFTYDIILSDLEPFSLHREFHWWDRAQEEGKFTRWPGLLFLWNKVKVLWIGRVGFPHVRWGTATLGRYLLSWSVFVLRLLEQTPPQSSLKKSMKWNKSTPISPKFTDKVEFSVRENQPHYYPVEAWGTRVCKTRECWRPREIRKSKMEKGPFKRRIHGESYKVSSYLSDPHPTMLSEHKFIRQEVKTSSSALFRNAHQSL